MSKATPATRALAAAGVAFTVHNEHGVMDHIVDAGTGGEIHIPLRVVQNGDGAEVMLTLYRQPGMSDERFAADAKWINADLKTLKGLFTPQRGR